MSLSFCNMMIAASVPLSADPLFNKVEWLTNSVFVAALVVSIVLFWARGATRRMELVPARSQNTFEAVVEGLYETLEGIVGKHMVGRTFGLLATLFLYILVANWFGLLPGVGSIGWGEVEGKFHFIPHIDVPLLRPATADLNMTLGIAAVFMLFWLYWAVAEMGFSGFIGHIFGVKGGLKGLMAVLLFPIFFFVGIIEVISIMFRPVSLSLRLYGNVFAGENLLVTMINLGKDLHFPTWLAYLSSVIIPIPFYFLELLVGVLQALVFTLLCAVYIQLATTHDEDSH